MIKINMMRPKYSGTMSWLTIAIRIIGYYEGWKWVYDKN